MMSSDMRVITAVEELSSPCCQKNSLEVKKVEPPMESHEYGVLVTRAIDTHIESRGELE